MVRLPKVVAFPEGVRHVDVTKVGRGILIVPVRPSWEDFFRNGPKVSDDFMTTRDDPKPEDRQSF
jgi:antitoxin VapB